MRTDKLWLSKKRVFYYLPYQSSVLNYVYFLIKLSLTTKPPKQHPTHVLRKFQTISKRLIGRRKSSCHSMLIKHLNPTYEARCWYNSFLWRTQWQITLWRRYNHHHARKSKEKFVILGNHRFTVNNIDITYPIVSFMTADRIKPDRNMQ